MSIACPVCDVPSKVLDTRGAMRRRECLGCGHRWTTYEVTAEDYRRLYPKPVRVVVPPDLKKDYDKLRRAGFTRDDTLKELGIVNAAQKG